MRLAIIVKVPLSGKNLLALKLTNERINGIITNHLERIAKAQYPLAFWASKQPMAPFHREKGRYTLVQLDDLRNESESVAGGVSDFEFIINHIIEAGGELRRTLQTQGWKMNLQIALQVMLFPYRIVQDEGQGRMKYLSNRFAMFLERLPWHCILAVRHRTLMCLEVLKLLERDELTKLKISHFLQHGENAVCKGIELSTNNFLTICYMFVMRLKMGRESPYDAWLSDGPTLGLHMSLLGLMAQDTMVLC